MMRMSDWTAPGGRPEGGEPQRADESRPAPRYGEYAPPGWTPPPPAAGAFAPPPPFIPQAQQAWTPPPKPGLLPLRPLTLGEVIGGSFQVMRRNPRPTLGFALLISVAVTLIVGGLTGLVGWALFSRVETAATEDEATITAGSVLLFFLTVLVSSVLSSALSSVVQGVVVLEVARGTVGEKHTLKSLWADVRGRIWALIGWTLLLAAAGTVLVALVALVVIAVGSTGPLGVGLAVALAILLGLGVIVVTAWIGTKLAFTPALIVIERRTVRSAAIRSWALTRSRFWRVFGITLLVNVIVSVAAQVIATPITVIGTMLGALINPNGTEEATSGVLIGTIILSTVVSALTTAVLLVAQAAVPAILYVDARMAQEGLDLELQHYVEQVAAGQRPPDPYRAAP